MNKIYKLFRDKYNYHIYFDDNLNEIQRNSFSKEDNTSKIKIIKGKDVRTFKNCL